MEIKGTATTPYIKFEPKQGKLEIRGRSVPENPIQFYMFWLESMVQYVANPVSPTVVTIHLEYFNTTSSRCILKILRHLKEVEAKGVKVIINWYYDGEDTDIKEVGEDFQSIVNLPFNIQKAE
ncbi:MAG TPA: DUF1987 domain-containing protein [Bacteroidia bacterium]|jgi:hypothetical protein|nr:DUF1987 domain-containing protein [Bacteroidia bacterium]